MGTISHCTLWIILYMFKMYNNDMRITGQYNGIVIMPCAVKFDPCTQLLFCYNIHCVQ